MKILRQLIIILGILMIGETINNLLNIPIPGNIIGMILLFLGLYFKIIKLDMVEDTSNFILKHLAFFFIPPGVALIALLDELSSIWLSFLVIIILSSIMVMAVTGIVVQQVMKRGEK